MADVRGEVRLYIWSWMEISSYGATHWYGQFMYDGELSDKIQHKATKKFAASYNKKCRWYYDAKAAELYSIKAGDMTACFDTQEDVIKMAKKQWRELYPNATRLVNDETDEVLDAKA